MPGGLPLNSSSLYGVSTNDGTWSLNHLRWDDNRSTQFFTSISPCPGCYGVKSCWYTTLFIHPGRWYPSDRSRSFFTSSRPSLEFRPHQKTAATWGTAAARAGIERLLGRNGGHNNFAWSVRRSYFKEAFHIWERGRILVSTWITLASCGGHYSWTCGRYWGSAHQMRWWFQASFLQSFNIPSRQSIPASRDEATVLLSLLSMAFQQGTHFKWMLKSYFMYSRPVNVDTWGRWCLQESLPFSNVPEVRDRFLRIKENQGSGQYHIQPATRS